MQETQVRSLGQEDPLEKEMATHASILAWRILWTEEPSRLQSVESQKVGHDLGTQREHKQGVKTLSLPSGCFQSSEEAALETCRIQCLLLQKKARRFFFAVRKLLNLIRSHLFVFALFPLL